MKSIGQVDSFGGIDADADMLLDECFQDHEAYIEAMTHSRPIILGRKGSGKTAIYRKMVNTVRSDAFAVGHTFADYPWHHHRLQGIVGVPEELRYVQSWRYLILLTMSKLLVNVNQSNYAQQNAPKQLESLKRFMVDTYGTSKPDVGKLFAPEKRLRIRPTLRIPGGSNLGVDLERLPMDQLPKIVSEVNDEIMAMALECISPEHDYFVCFDELDRGFEPQRSEYMGMLVGLLLAAKSLNDSARIRDKKLSVLVFLRDDIYHLLRFEDKNKITDRLVSRIEWDSPRTKWTLKQLMESRFTSVMGGGKSVGWDAVFDENKEMAGRQSKYRHMLDRTFRRPRDIIKFCNEVLATCRSRGGSGKFTNEDVTAARAGYSDYLLRELEDEIHKHLPEYEDYLELVRAVGKAQFTREQWGEVCERRGAGGSVAANDILRKLFEFSIVGFQRTGGIGGGSEYVWRYCDERARFDGLASSYRVHPGLVETLSLKKWAKD